MTPASRRRQPGDGVVAGGRANLRQAANSCRPPSEQLLDLRLSEDGSKRRRQAESGYPRLF